MEYDESYINNLIASKAEETLTLEFKRPEALNKSEDIAKDVSAMANSAGGILIYGIIEKDHKAESVAFVDGNKVTKETIDRVINSRIHRKISDLKIIPIRFEGDISKAVYVIEIPASDEAPHMAENRFYKRYNFESKPMDEYEVRNLYFRSQRPILEFVDPTFTYNPNSSNVRKNAKGKYELFKGEIILHLKNVGRVVCRDYKVDVYIPEKIFHQNTPFDHQEIVKFPKCHYGDRIAFSVSSNVPVYPGENMSRIIYFEFVLKGDSYDQFEKVLLKLKLYYDGGVLEKEWNLKDILMIDGKSFEKDDFVHYKAIKYRDKDFK